MSDADRIVAFITLAEEELAAARLLAKPASRQAAYFIQQAAEKAARAILIAAGVPFGTGHNLGQMAAALPATHTLRDAINALDKHSVAATRYRYPSPAGRLADVPTVEAVESGIEEVGAFIERVKRHLVPAR